MSNFEYISILVKRYFFYIGYLFLCCGLHFSEMFFQELNLVLFHHYIGYIFLSAIGFTHQHSKVPVNADIMRWFYLINILYYLLMCWYAISPELDVFNQWVILLLAIILLYIGIEKVQTILIQNMPNSEHDRKLRKFEMWVSKIQHFEHVIDRDDLTDSEKVKFMKHELSNLK